MVNHITLTLLTVPVTSMTTSSSTNGSIVRRSRSLNQPFGWTLSDRNVPEFNRAQSAWDISSIMSVIKFPAINNTKIYIIMLFFFGVLYTSIMSSNQKIFSWSTKKHMRSHIKNSFIGLQKDLWPNYFLTVEYQALLSWKYNVCYLNLFPATLSLKTVLLVLCSYSPILHPFYYQYHLLR